jgi:O-acetyl-ADP-ribose deacetylase (regulator of RNase III)
MGAGIAPQMAKAFGCDSYPLEARNMIGNIDKLGRIEYDTITRSNETPLWVVNCYTQYGLGRNHDSKNPHPLDYYALALCFKKLNHVFKGKHIGLPLIGCGLAGGDPERVIPMMKSYIKDCPVTLVHYKP